MSAVQQRSHYLQAIICGGLLPCAFAPLNWWLLALLCPAWLYHLIQRTSPKQSFVIGYCFGLGFFGVGVSWIYVSIHVYGGAPMLLAGLLTGAFVAFLALYCGLVTGLTTRLFHKKWAHQLGFASLWVLQELFRSWFLTGFPWLLLGYTQIDGPLKGFAPLIGVYGISFCLMLLALLVWNLIQRPERFSQRMVLFFCFVGLVGLAQPLANKSWTTLANEEQTVQIIQGNIKPYDKFTMLDPIQGALNAYGRLMFERPPARYIIWPENGITLPLPEAKPLIQALDQWAKKADSTLLVGIPIQAPNQAYYYNSILALGQGQGVYHKRHLVPFGEYVPFEKYLRGLIGFFDLPMSAFIKGPKTQPMHTPHSQLLPLVCYEIAYPDYVRAQLKSHHADVIITLIEDGWFGRSLGPHQHLQVARMRALETGRFIIRSTPTGISAIIDASGQVISQTPQYEAAVLEGYWKNASGFTPYTHLSVFWIIGFLSLLFASALLGDFLAKRRQRITKT